jgi:hypothetical protein
MDYELARKRVICAVGAFSLTCASSITLVSTDASHAQAMAIASASGVGCTYGLTGVPCELNRSPGARTEARCVGQ